VLFHPLRFRGQAAHQRAIQAAWRLVIDVFHRSGALQPRVAQAPGQGAVFFPTPLAIDQQAETLLKAESSQIGFFQLLAKSIGHAVQTHNVEFVQSLLIEHRCPH
jgi:hypothetical protein